MTDTSKVERYAVSRNSSGLGYSNGLVPAQDGGFVSYGDYTDLRTELDEMTAYALAATKAITGLTPNGSEFFGPELGGSTRPISNSVKVSFGKNVSLCMNVGSKPLPNWTKPKPCVSA